VCPASGMSFFSFPEGERGEERHFLISQLAPCPPTESKHRSLQPFSISSYQWHILAWKTQLMRKKWTHLVKREIEKHDF
jgi:hypothetical protein